MKAEESEKNVRRTDWRRRRQRLEGAGENLKDIIYMYIGVTVLWVGRVERKRKKPEKINVQTKFFKKRGKKSRKRVLAKGVQAVVGRESKRERD